MKYLKLFENWNTVEDEKLRQEFIDITNNYLSYLLDDGVEIGFARLSYPVISDNLPERVKDIQYKSQRPYVYMAIDFTKSTSEKIWDDVKDMIISYLEYISTNYKLKRKFSGFDKPSKLFELGFTTQSTNLNAVKYSYRESNNRINLEVDIDELLTKEFNEQIFYDIPIDQCYPTVLRARIFL